MTVRSQPFFPARTPGELARSVFWGSVPVSAHPRAESVAVGACEERFKALVRISASRGGAPNSLTTEEGRTARGWSESPLLADFRLVSPPVEY